MQKKKVVRKAVCFRAETWQRLEAYLHKEFPGHNVLSAIVDTAVNFYLNHKTHK